MDIHIKLFKNINRGEFFELIVNIKKNNISISVDDQTHCFDIEELDLSGFDNKLCLNQYYANDKIKFNEYIQKEVLNKLNVGTFGFRVHPHELATIRRMELNVF